MKHRISAISVILAVLALLLVGCGSQATQGNTDTKPAKAAATDINALLSLDEAKKTTSLALQTPELKKDTNPMKQDILFFPMADNSSYVQLSLLQDAKIPADLGQSAEAIYTNTKKLMGTVTPVTGIGKDAFWEKNGLHILVEGKYLVISTGNSSDQANLDQEKALAAIILPKL